ncbi:ankyrin repeat domain-containing protein [Sphingobacterium faecium]|uniref:ankyrin repeat domain-containing protein n=1 Tax=Sphingobacterium faecium TaxID=34087 RepID=UPI000D4F269F|nr:ankyrin repeat domain-containing protein [Sphingobacterium faecium]PTX09789.1 ankyrin repeat protein [Sphingobacterium faecium]
MQKNQLALVEEALKNGSSVHIADQDGKSLLLIATQNNALDMAKLLLSYQADVNQQDHIKDSPFLYAGATGNLELVKLYLLHGAR